MKAQTILDTIGNTPHVRINRLFGRNLEVWLKLERANPGGSIKDRIALGMVEDAEKKGLINQDTTLIEPTSGNTGIGLAMVAAVKGYKLILVMPESMTVERRRYMTALGAKLELTPREKGIKGSIERAYELKDQTPNSWIPMQFENQANTEAHRATTVNEILQDFPEGVDAIVTGIGTGGHITACGEELKKRFSSLKMLGVEPAKSSVLSGGTHTPHKIQGIGTGFVPEILNREVLDGTIQVTEEEAFEYAGRAAREEGIFIGISSGATLAAIAKKAPEFRGQRILGFCYDTGERYLSVEGLFP